MTQAIAATGNEAGPILKEFRKVYNIWNGVNNIGDSWDEIKQSTMNRSWRKICPQFVTDFQDVEETPEQITKEVVYLRRQLNLKWTKQMLMN
jgi:L-rhamnose mutarotase